MFLKIYPQNPNPKAVQQVADCLRAGGIVIFPTDTIYGMGCDIYKPKAVEKIISIMGDKKKKDALSFICHDLSQLSDFTTPIENQIFKAMKRALPGPYTFILNANNHVPKMVHGAKKTVGIRVPDNDIIRAIIEELGHPVFSTSIKDDDEIVEYTTDPELIYEKYGHLVDIVVDGGYGDNVPSTIVDCTSGSIEVIREGKGDSGIFE
ncbi:MAG: L-threonylcarbamoyladenylate synthase [Bacteroidetes bacterium]|nr:L-threonylcarbamoyladenylate synthase [Bacteroidota bacterium]MCL2303350.1 L-threonylcarbamoyladenylate synthase [Lentimicrobiaceae bacterium]